MDFLLLLFFSIIVFLLVRYYLRSLTIGSYHDRYVFITGCDTGFGNLLAKKLDSMGMHVFAGCLTQKGQKELKKATSERLVTVSLDVTNEKDIENAYEKVKESLPEGKGLWGLVNNAGVFRDASPIEWLTIDHYRKCNDVNLYGMIQVTTVFIPLVRKAKGRIVNVTSMTGRIAFGPGPYVVSKYGAEGFSDTLRYEMYKCGVSVHIVEPGMFLTPILNVEALKAGIRDRFLTLDSERREFYGENYSKGLEEVLDNIPKVGSTRLYKVADANTHALTAVYPKARYVVGWDANIILLTLWNFPEWLCTRIATIQLPIPKGSKTT